MPNDARHTHQGSGGSCWPLSQSPSTKAAAPTHLPQQLEGALVPSTGCRAGPIPGPSGQEPSSDQLHLWRCCSLLPLVSSLQCSPCPSLATQYAPGSPAHTHPPHSPGPPLLPTLEQVCHLLSPNSLPSSHFHSAPRCQPQLLLATPGSANGAHLLRSVSWHHSDWASAWLRTIPGPIRIRIPAGAQDGAMIHCPHTPDHRIGSCCRCVQAADHGSASGPGQHRAEDRQGPVAAMGQAYRARAGILS